MVSRIRIYNTYAIPHRRSAFALLDVLVAGLILAGALTALLGLGSRSLRAQIQGERRLHASMLADEILSEIAAVGPEDYPGEYAMSGTAEEPYTNLEYEIDIQDDGLSRPYRVTVTVSWVVNERVYEERVETLLAPMLGEVEEDERVPDKEIYRP